MIFAFLGGERTLLFRLGPHMKWSRRSKKCAASNRCVSPLGAALALPELALYGMLAGSTASFFGHPKYLDLPPRAAPEMPALAL